LHPLGYIVPQARASPLGLDCDVTPKQQIIIARLISCHATERRHIFGSPILYLTMAKAVRIVIDSNYPLLGGDVAGEGAAGKPGSGGTSPYQIFR
jgi:hypothetical protein